MAGVSDIGKLRPELLEISDAEFERRQAEFEMARIERERRKEIAGKEWLATEANKHIDAVVAGVKFLHDNGLLSEKVTSGFSRSDGMFSPSMYLRNVTTDMLIGTSSAAKPRQRRKQLIGAEREAAIAAGTLKPRVRKTKGA